MGLISRVSSRTYRNQKSKNPTHTMIIPTEDRLKIWRTLFQEGVMVAKKNTRTVHKETNIRNLFVMNALKSLKSKGFVKENFTWQHYHYALTDEGITYLREQLNLPENVMPATLKRTQETQPRPDRGARKVGESRPVYGDRQGYRREGGGDKAGDAGPGTGSFQYKGGYGRGRPAAMASQPAE